MAHLLNLNNKKTEFPNNLNEDVDSKQSHQDKDTSGSTTLDSKKMSSSEKSAQKKIPIIIPKLKIHSPLAMKIPISPRALKSPKRNPEEKKQLPEKEEEFIDIEEIKKTSQKNGQLRMSRIWMLIIKKMTIQFLQHQKL